MRYADFNFYKNEYNGIVIDKEGDYAYFSERAGDELALFINRIPNNEEAQNALKRCACRVADILYYDFKASKNGQKISSESVSGYYSVSYSIADKKEIQRQINTAVTLFLGRYILGGSKRVII